MTAAEITFVVTEATITYRRNSYYDGEVVSSNDSI